MISTAASSLVWDLTQEPPTLGGALVLRMEGEWMMRHSPDETIPVHTVGAAKYGSRVSHLFDEVFRASARPFELTEAPAERGDVWPTAADREAEGFSYVSFKHLLTLFLETKHRPRLYWHPAILAAAADVRRRFSGTLVCVHLRRVPPFSMPESNADPAVWGSFLQAHARSNHATFLLLGQDPLPPEIHLGPKVVRADDLGLPLGVQLALVNLADGFLGMASGVCTAANFSDTPHVIFKHPEHHAVAMQRELGASNRFSFAAENQQLWRQVASRAVLDEALDLILT